VSDTGVIGTLSPCDYDAVLFDLDGVLTRTASGHAAARKKLFDASIQRAGGAWSAELTAIANGIEVTGRLEPGWPVKVPVRQTYGGSRA
jgi:phosphoglycolate phosphatase-like HAD superfamily hydrolase